MAKLFVEKYGINKIRLTGNNLDAAFVWTFRDMATRSSA